MSPTQPTFTPHQMLAPTAELSAELTGDTTDQVAVRALELLPPFQPGARVLDNGSRGGFLTEKILRGSPPPDLRITSVDPDPSMVAMAERRAVSHGWPQESFVRQPESLGFPDGAFTHSFTNFLLPYTRNGGADAATEIHRTLRTGGTAVVSTWSVLPHQAPLAAAHAATRPPGTVLPLGVQDRWYQASHVRAVLGAAGFDPRALATTSVEAELEVPDLQRWATIAWSLLGAPAGGWTASDEDEWDTAVAVLTAGIEAARGVRRSGQGTTLMSLTANITLAAA